MAESALGYSCGVRTLTQMKIWCVKDMYMLNVVLSGKPLGVKGLLCIVPVTSWYQGYHIILYLPVGNGVLVSGIDVQFGIVVPLGTGVIILHSTREGSGLHLPSLPHVALRYNGTRSDC